MVFVKDLLIWIHFFPSIFVIAAGLSQNGCRAVPAGKADASRRPRRRPSCGRGCGAHAGGLAGRACGWKHGEGTGRTAPCDHLGSVRESPRDSRRILWPLSGLDLLLT